jgi:hypothetical protein
MKTSNGGVPFRQRCWLRISTVLFCFLFAGILSSAPLLKGADAGNPRYLNQVAIEKVILTLKGLPYPLTRAETLDRLDLTDRRLPSSGSLGPKLPPGALVTNHRELIHLTAPTAGRSYSLLLWYAPAARYLSGDDYVSSKIIIDVELLDGRTIGRLEHPLIAYDYEAVEAARLGTFVEQPFGPALAVMNLPAEKLKVVKDLLLKRVTARELAEQALPPGLTRDQRDEAVARAEGEVDRTIQAVVDPAAFEKIHEMTLIRDELNLIRLNYAPLMTAAGEPLDGPSSVALAKVFKAVYSDVQAGLLKKMDFAALREAKTPQEKARAYAWRDEYSAYRTRDVDAAGLSAPDRELVRQTTGFLSQGQLTALKKKLVEITRGWLRLEAERQGSPERSR